MVRLVLIWVGSPWAFELKPGLNTLGRNPTNDFRIADPSISSFHAELAVDNGRIRVRDLGSTNGTFLDDQPVREDAWLTTERSLRLGTVRLRLEEVFVNEQAAVPVTQSGLAGASAELPHACAYHSEVLAAFRCENCGGTFCSECVKVVGHDRSGATTLCPVCQGQCDPIPLTEEQRTEATSFLRRLTRTLKVPFAR
jgi:FHA domain